MSNCEAELAAAIEHHERSMALIEAALGTERSDGTTWRAQEIADEIRALRAQTAHTID